MDWWRIIKLACLAVISLFVGYKFRSAISENPGAVNTVVIIFSILAGFLISVITLIAEPVIKKAQSWDELQRMKRTVRNRLFRQKILFFLYLSTLGMALIMYITPDEMKKVIDIFQGVFLTLTTFVFLSSFFLPGSLIKIQMAKYEAEIEKKRPEVLKEARANSEKSKSDPKNENF